MISLSHPIDRHRVIALPGTGFTLGYICKLYLPVESFSQYFPHQSNSEYFANYIFHCVFIRFCCTKIARTISNK